MTKNSKLLDAIIISDTHLGSSVCESKQLYAFLGLVYTKTNKLIINGDFFDNLDFRRLKKNHWKILSLLRRMSKYVEIVWIRGNHDGDAENISHLIGLNFQNEYIFSSGNKNFLCLHGDQFDDFIYKYPNTTRIADFIYRTIQRFDKKFLPKFIKHRSKTYLRCNENMMEKSRNYSIDKQIDCVCLGHTHYPLLDKNHSVWYANSGCWTEKTCTYLGIKDGIITLEKFV
jgi:UDP-2,3-diacylglucosamine pyrophosphatase LpxH